MPLLAIFSRKDKSKSKDNSSLSTSSNSGHDPSERDYVWSPSALAVPSLDNGSYRYSHSNDSQVSSNSSTKIRMLFRRKQHSSSPLVRTLEPLHDENDYLTAASTARNDNTIRPSSNRHPVAPSFLDESAISSTRSLPADARRRPPITPLQKVDSSPSVQTTAKSSGGLFSWVTRERTKSKPSPPVLPPLPADVESFESFNLKSFRHVQLTESPATTHVRSDALEPPARPRGSSMASSDSTQRISVGQFRAQARRSSTNVASANNSPSVRPVSLADSQINLDKDLPPPRPPRAVRPSPSPVRHSKVSSSAIETSSESCSGNESDSDELSPSRSRSRLSRQQTITQKSRVSRSDIGHGAGFPSHHRQTTSSRSEHGHGSPSRGSPARGPPPSSFQKSTTPPVPAIPPAPGGTRSVYKRQQGSYSTSELTPTAAAQRASVIAAAKAQLSAPKANQRPALPPSDSDTSESSSESSSDEDAPLATFLNPSRPSSSMSHSTATTSTARPAQQRGKPLIDLKADFNPISGKPISHRSSQVEEKGRESPSYLSPTNISDRLSQLTLGIGSSPGSDTGNASTSKGVSKSFSSSDFRPLSRTPDRTASPASTSTPDNRFRTSERDTPSPSRFMDKPLTASPTKAMHSPLHETAHEAASSKVVGMNHTSAIPARGRAESSDRGFKVISRPQRSHTSPSLSSESNNGSGSNVSSQPPRLELQHRLSSTFAVTSRPTSGLSFNAETSKVHSDRALNVPTSRTSSSTSPVAQIPPQRPFAGAKRRDSPSSSTGGSSCSKAPLTPMDGSDYFSPEVHGGSEESPGNSTSGGVASAMKGARRQIKRGSVTFQEPESGQRDFEKARSRSSSHGALPRPTVTLGEGELKRRERRRSEARAAIELGNVINGRGPIDDDDDDNDADSDVAVGGGRNRTSVVNPLMGGSSRMSFTVPSSTTSAAPNAWQGMQAPGMPGMFNMGMNPSQYFLPPTPASADPTFLAAHQQAMMVAKQAYQMAVAQQAMAAAADEWERNSNAGGFGQAMGMNAGMGMGGMGWMPPMFPAGARSMYGGSSVGGQSNVGVGWGSASVYGESFGPPAGTITRRSHGMPGSDYPSDSKHTSSRQQSSSNNRSSATAFPRSESAGNISGMHPSSRNGGASSGAHAHAQAHGSSGTKSAPPRQRTKTAPSNTTLPPQHARFEGRNSPAPPSSWKLAH